MLLFVDLIYFFIKNTIYFIIAVYSLVDLFHVIIMIKMQS